MFKTFLSQAIITVYDQFFSHNNFTPKDLKKCAAGITRCQDNPQNECPLFEAQRLFSLYIQYLKETRI